MRGVPSCNDITTVAGCIEAQAQASACNSNEGGGEEADDGEICTISHGTAFRAILQQFDRPDGNNSNKEENFVHCVTVCSILERWLYRCWQSLAMMPVPMPVSASDGSEGKAKGKGKGRGKGKGKRVLLLITIILYSSAGMK